MLLYVQIFRREMCTIIYQTGRPDWPGSVTSQFYAIFFEMIVKIIFNNYLLINEVELVQIFFTSTYKHINNYLISFRKLDFTRSVSLS